MIDESLLKEYKGKIPEPLLKEFVEYGEEVKINKKEQKEVLERLYNRYLNSKIHPGEAIGMITAESFGEPSTQMTLRTFHFAGVAEAQISLGLPRLIEVFDARQDIETPIMEIYLKKQPENELELEKIISKIKGIKLFEILSEISVNLANMQIEIKLNKKRMKELNIDSSAIEKALKTSIKTAEFTFEDDILAVKPKLKENSLQALFMLKEKLKDMHIKGIEGVKQVNVVKRKEELVLLAFGTNLKKVLEIEEVDPTRTISNDIFEMARVFGIEAARNSIIKEASRVLHDQGLEIDDRHIMFVADLMTNTGTIKGVTRSGITGEKESVLARASFETPIVHIMNASLTGEVDKLNSVVENVLINQPVPLGTGLPSLVTKMVDEENKK